jgi:hypothetical protein
MSRPDSRAVRDDALSGVREMRISSILSIIDRRRRTSMEGEARTDGRQGQLGSLIGTTMLRRSRRRRTHDRIPP